MPTAPLKLHGHDPMYGWALDDQDLPIPISVAKRGQKYFCPVCKGEMVPKMGGIKQHHYAHVSLVQCTPDNVALMVAVRWLGKEFREKIAAEAPVMVTWHTKDRQESHTINILKGIAAVVESYDMDEDQADLALLDADGQPKVAILTGMRGVPSPEMIARLTANGMVVILLDATGVRSGQIDLRQLLEQSDVHGGWWTLDKEELPDNLVTDPKMIRALLRIVANKPPYRFYGELHEDESLAHILDLEGRKLWLPPEIWLSVIGGTRNNLGRGVTIMTQEWAQDDRSSIALFYVTAHNTSAVAVRRFPPGQPVRYELGTAAFRLSKITAQELAEKLAGGMIAYPE